MTFFYVEILFTKVKRSFFVKKKKLFINVFISQKKILHIDFLPNFFAIKKKDEKLHLEKPTLPLKKILEKFKTFSTSQFFCYLYCGEWYRWPKSFLTTWLVCLLTQQIGTHHQLVTLYLRFWYPLGLRSNPKIPGTKFKKEKMKIIRFVFLIKKSFL